jgi:hypothetical protein
MMLKAGVNALSFREDGRERPFVCARRGGEQQAPQDVILDDDEL